MAETRSYLTHLGMRSYSETADLSTPAGMTVAKDLVAQHMKNPSIETAIVVHNVGSTSQGTTTRSMGDTKRVTDYYALNVVRTLGPR